MRVTTFLTHKNGQYKTIKNFFDMSVINTGSIAYIDRDTKESIPSEIHHIYIISNNGKFRDVAYNYAKNKKLHLFEAYSSCHNNEIDVSDSIFTEKIEPRYKTFKTYKYIDGFTLSNEFTGCYAYRLDYFLGKKTGKKWLFQEQRDEYFFSKIDYSKINSN